VDLRVNDVWYELAEPSKASVLGLRSVTLLIRHDEVFTPRT
jgi:hypothetical protein